VAQHCSKCQRRKTVDYHVEPAEAWKVVALNRWPVGKLCASCFDAEAERARVRYTFVNVTAQSWNEQPAPRNPYKRKR
jgi:hypothetical protein